MAFGLARRLRDRGDKVAFVGLFATLPPGRRFLRLWAWTAHLYRSLAHRVVSYKKLPLDLDTGHASAGALEELRAIAVSALSASATYRPGRYAGEVTLLSLVTATWAFLHRRSRGAGTQARCVASACTAATTTCWGGQCGRRRNSAVDVPG